MNDEQNNYPQLNAAASLKLEGYIPGPIRTWDYPQLNAAASLKPQLGEMMYDIAQQNYPQLNAAASLKPASRARDEIYSHDYPQLNAAASLKRVFYLHTKCDAWALSAAKCCGLIEARTSMCVHVPYDPLSAAKCCGLIEATLHRDTGYLHRYIIRS